MKKIPARKTSTSEIPRSRTEALRLLTQGTDRVAECVSLIRNEFAADHREKVRLEAEVERLRIELRAASQQFGIYAEMARNYRDGLRIALKDGDA